MQRTHFAPPSSSNIARTQHAVSGLMAAAQHVQPSWHSHANVSGGGAGRFTQNQQQSEKITIRLKSEWAEGFCIKLPFGRHTEAEMICVRIGGKFTGPPGELDRCSCRHWVERFTVAIELDDWHRRLHRQTTGLP